jgi:hypothetical protein
MEVLRLFGAYVGRDVANETWQLGYALALSRVVHDPKHSNALPTPLASNLVLERARGLFADRGGRWVGIGLAGPIDTSVILDSIRYITDQFRARLRPLIGLEGESQALGDLRRLALRGFGIGRLQVEPAFLKAVATSVPNERSEAQTGTSATLESIVPSDTRAALESAGAVLALDAEGRSISIGLNGLTLARVSAAPPGFVWSQDALGVFLRELLEYDRKARLLQENRARDTFALRGLLREALGIDELLVAASHAGCTVSRKGSLTVKEFYLTHPAFGEFARLAVLRGQSHVVDVAFSSPRVFVPIRFLVGMDQSLERSSGTTLPV